MVLWLTGLSGAGKTTLCKALWALLKPGLPELIVLDGDAVRQMMGHDLGHDEASRAKQVARLRALAKFLSDQGHIVLVAAVYTRPDLTAESRKAIRGFFQVYLDATLDTVKKRDTKGLYSAAQEGRTAHVVGVDIPWHPPADADLVVKTGVETAEQAARRIAAAVPRLARALEKA
ncbi:MAG: adenylyl-sulfate kinase [Elusimicrobiota bacterium]|nr:MAG: adenylyl-sulfate kinase [Elusimicrobiota bacterium]